MKGTYASPRDSIPQRATTAPPLSRLSAAPFLLVFCFALLNAQPVRFERISSEQGLPDATIICIIKDRLGFMWFGTTGGLIRYDGYSFRQFQERPAEPGVLWLGTLGGVKRFDCENSATMHWIRICQTIAELRILILFVCGETR
jgi:ligand-binding sensor domain-containing protein